MSKFLNISTDNTLGGNSAANDVVPSQKAIKEYVETKLPLKIVTFGITNEIYKRSNTLLSMDAISTNAIVSCAWYI